MTAEEIEAWLKARIAETLRLPAGAVGREHSFAALGLDSLSLLTITGDLASWLERDLPIVLAWENPTVATLAGALAQDAPRPGPGAPSRAPRDRPLPLSHAQERMWRECHAQATQARYSLHLRFLLRGPLRVEALRRALDQLVGRHEILRTTFGELGEKPVQTVHASTPCSFAFRDLRGLSPEAAAREAREAEAGAMDLERGPLFSATLLRLGEAEHNLILTLHHLLGDFQSARILYRDLGALYATPDPEAASLPAAQQVADAACAERERWAAGTNLRAERLAAWLAEWSQPLPPACPRPLLRCRRFAKAPLDQASRSAPVAASTISALETLAAREETTLYTILLAAFAFALLQHAGAPQMLLGTYVSSRGTESRDSLGLFIQLFPLRLDLRGAGTFRDLLGRVRESVKSSATYPEAPLEDFTRALRGRGHTPPVPELLFQLLRSPIGFLHLDGLETKRWSAKNVPAHMPAGLVLNVHELDGHFSATMSFDATRYRPARVASLHRTFLSTLEVIAKRGDCPLPAAPTLWRRLQLLFTSI